MVWKHTISVQRSNGIPKSVCIFSDIKVLSEITFPALTPPTLCVSFSPNLSWKLDTRNIVISRETTGGWCLPWSYSVGTTNIPCLSDLRLLLHSGLNSTVLQPCIRILRLREWYFKRTQSKCLSTRSSKFRFLHYTAPEMTFMLTVLESGQVAVKIFQKL